MIQKRLEEVADQIAAIQPYYNQAGPSRVIAIPKAPLTAINGADEDSQTVVKVSSLVQINN